MIGLRISVPLSETTVGVVANRVVEVGEPGGELVGKQPFGVERLEQQDLDLGAGEFGGEDGNDSLARDDVDDGLGVLGRDAPFEL